MNSPKIQLERNQVRETYSEAGMLFGTLGITEEKLAVAAECAAQKAALPVKALPRSHSPNDSRREMINLPVCKKAWLGELLEANCKSHAVSVRLNRPVPCLCLKVLM